MTEAEAKLELQNLAARGHKLRQQEAATKAELVELDTATANVKKQAAGGLDDTLAHQLITAELGVSAARAGAFNPDQVTACLSPQAVLIKEPSGKHKVFVLGDDGRAKDADEACLDYMTDHLILVRADHKDAFAERRWRRDEVAKCMASPPTTPAELQRIDSRVRQDVVNAMSPEQRAELAETKPIPNIL